MAVPAITSITPTGGSVAGGETITIVGTDLGTPSAVKFGTTDATAYVGESATRAYAVVPAGTGAKFVTLTTAGGTSATGAASTYTYGAVLFTVAEYEKLVKLKEAIFVKDDGKPIKDVIDLPPIVKKG